MYRQGWGYSLPGSERKFGALWLSVQEGESETLLTLLPALTVRAWGGRPGLESYLNGFYRASLTCQYPAEFEVLIKKEAGYWSKYRWFWWHSEPSEPILAERLMSALARLDIYTEDWDERIMLRKQYLRQLEANVVGLLMESRHR